ncbi:MAG: hypothetical protein ABIO70_30430 [Pseudomonadota bacterium]
MPVLTLLLAAALPCLGATPFGLPPGEPAGAWDIVLADVGFEPGAAGDAGAWARLEQAAEGGCALLVSTGRGAVQREPVPCPARAAEREELAALAAVMLAPLVTMAVPPMPPVESPPAPPAVVVARPVSARAPPSAGRLSPSAPRSFSPPPTVASPPPSPLPVIWTGPLPAEATPSDPAPAKDGEPTGEGAWNVRGCGCAIDFPLRCATTERCSTAERCPDVWFQDRDQDGYSGVGSACLLESRLTRMSRNFYVQVVGDLDDQDPEVHPEP